MNIRKKTGDISDKILQNLYHIANVIGKKIDFKEETKNIVIILNASR